MGLAASAGVVEWCGQGPGLLSSHAKMTGQGVSVQCVSGWVRQTGCVSAGAAILCVPVVGTVYIPLPLLLCFNFASRPQTHVRRSVTDQSPECAEPSPRPHPTATPRRNIPSCDATFHPAPTEAHIHTVPTSPPPPSPPESPQCRLTSPPSGHLLHGS